MLDVKYVRSKKFLLDTLTKCGISPGRASTTEALQDIVIEQVTILLITAAELKEVAERWYAKTSGKMEDPFPLGYLIQPGRFNPALLPLT